MRRIQAAVALEHDRVGVDRPDEARPSRAGVELVVGGEQRLPAAGAAERAVEHRVVVLAGARPLGPLLAEHANCSGVEAVAPLLLGSDRLARQDRPC